MDPTHSGNVRDQSLNFVWLGEPQNPGIYRKHYGAFRKDGIEITVNSFVLVLSDEQFHHIGYIEDLYENKNGSKKAKLRWFHRHIEVNDLFPDLDRNSEEIYFTRSIQLIDVESIDSIATVLTPDHYSRCLDLLDGTIKPLSNCGIYMCCKEIADDAIGPFDLSQLPGYSNQCILSSFLSHEERASLSTDLPCGNPSMQFARRARSQKKKRLKTVHSDDSNSVSEEQIANSVSEEQVANSVASCSTSRNQMPPKMKLKKLMHSVGSELDGSKLVEVWACEYENFEVLSPRFPGRWLRCQILLKSPKIIVVKYHDGEAGNLEEVLPPESVAPPDKLGMRLAGRMTLRPSPPQDSSNKCLSPPQDSSNNCPSPPRDSSNKRPSPPQGSSNKCPSPPQDSSNNSIQLGESVDVWLHKSWCEGVFISPGGISTPDRFLVYLPEENILETFHIGDLRVSKDWIDKKWKEVPRKLDILSVISSMLAVAAANANP